MLRCCRSSMSTTATEPTDALTRMRPERRCPWSCSRSAAGIGPLLLWRSMHTCRKIVKGFQVLCQLGVKCTRSRESVALERRLPEQQSNIGNRKYGRRLVPNVEIG